MLGDIVVGVATVVIAITGVAYTVGTFRLLKATRDMFKLNFILAFTNAKRGGQLSGIEEKKASARLDDLLKRHFPDDVTDLTGGPTT